MVDLPPAESAGSLLTEMDLPSAGDVVPVCRVDGLGG